MFHHGLFLADDRVKKYVREKDFLDCGSFDGCSALVFHKFYQPRKMYSFDISKQNCMLYVQNMELNAIPEWKYEMLNCGVSDKSDEALILDDGRATVSLEHCCTKNTQDGLSIKTTRIDDFTNSRKNMDVGFIKADVEGYGLKALMGMRETIEKFRPVLSLSIYHNPEEFFEMKPLLDTFTEKMKYRISIVELGDGSFVDLSEVSIFAYPEL